MGNTRGYLFQTFYIFALLGIVFIPVQFNLFPWQQQITDGTFGSLIHLLGNLFQVEIANVKVSSDSTSMYLLTVILFLFALVISGTISFLLKNKTIPEQYFSIIRTIIYYYLTVQLLKYGFDKIFKYQFYLPEPNTLYTPLGNLSKDILYWSSMGTSYGYSVFAGSLEIIAALLILFKKTRVLGLIIALGVMINVLAINFGFDISVKLFSMFLIFLISLLLQPQFKRLHNFFVLNQSTFLHPEISLSESFKNDSVGPTIKTFLICLCLVESLFPYMAARNFNDDAAVRPYLHGAYEVLTTNNSINENNSSLKRIFIHREGYFIFQDKNDHMKDYKLVIDQEKHQFLLTDYNQHQRTISYTYNPKDSVLNLQYFSNRANHQLKAKSLDWKKLPALQNDFHWTVDSFK